jgi:hypothetical protein
MSSFQADSFLKFVRSTEMHRLLQGNWLSPSEAAERLHYSRWAIHKMCNRKRLDYITVPGLGRLINVASIDFFQKVNRHDSV